MMRIVSKGWLVIVMLLGVQAAGAQEQQYALSVRGMPLDEALERFVRATGRAVSYDPTLVEGQRVFCGMKAGDAEEVLRCLLDGSGLDFYRLSSGTYVLTRPVEVVPVRGTVVGTVVDEETGAPLAGAHVLLADAGVGTVTNEAGQFVLPPLLPGQYIIRISHIGYGSWHDSLRVAPSRRTTATAALRAEPILIAPVVIDGLQRRPSDRLRVDAVQVADAQRPPGAGGALRPLDALPGIQRNDVTADVHVQGGEASEHQLRLDGVPVYLPQRALGFVGPFSPFAIEQIRVYKAGFDASQGSHLAGVVQAEHTLGVSPGVDLYVDPLSANARLRLGAADPAAARSTALMVAGRVGLWNLYHPPSLQTTLDTWSLPDVFLFGAPLQGAASSELNVQPAEQSVPQTRSSPAFNFSDAHLAFRHRWSPLRTLNVSLYQGRTRLGGSSFAIDLPGLTSSASDGAHLIDQNAPAIEDPTLQDDVRAPVTIEDDYIWMSRTGQARYDAVVGDRSLLTVQAWLSTYDLDHRYELLDSLSLYLQGATLNLNRAYTTPVRDGNQVRDAALEAAFEHAWNRHHLRLGAEVNRTQSRFRLLAINVPGLEQDYQEYFANAGFANLEASQTAVQNIARAWRTALHAEDTWHLDARTQLEAGVRLTYLASRQTVYAEPRLGLRRDLDRWSWRVAAGLYRQFVNQFDVSKLNTGALLPSVRIWLPVDGSVRPPMAYHLAASTLFTPAPDWSVRWEGYWKYQPHLLEMTYRLPDGFEHRYLVNRGGGTRPLSAQQAFLASARGQAYGTALSVVWEGAPGRAEARYEFSRAVRSSPARFGGRTVPVPWNEPHRAELALDWRPLPPFVVSLRGQGVWGRAWGFRQAYYDYFGQDDALRRHNGYDLGRPGDHVLPAYYQLDLGLAYTRTLGNIELQARLDVLNVLDRPNVLDWRLVYDDDGSLHKVDRPSYPRLTMVSLRVGW